MSSALAITDYTNRQPKPFEQAIIPINTAIEFKLDKNKMKFKVDGKSFEFIVVSQAAASSPTAARALFRSQSSVARAGRLKEGEENCIERATSRGIPSCARATRRRKLPVSGGAT